MQELYRADGHRRADGHPGSDLFASPATAVDPMSVASPEDRSVRQRLDEARQVADSGDPRMARVMCAEVVFEQLPLLARDRELLGIAIATLIHARGFQMLNRLLVAVDGRQVRVSLGTPSGGAASPPHLIGRSEAAGGTTFMVSERLYHDPSRDAVIANWSTELAHGHARRQSLAAS